MTRATAWLVLLLLLTGAGGLPAKPPSPTLNGGLLTVRVDPARPEVHLDWNVTSVEGASAIDYEISQGPFRDRNPASLTEKPLREGHFPGASGWGRLDLQGLGEGEYFVRYLAVDPRGRAVSLASDPVRFVIIGRGPNPAPTVGTKSLPGVGSSGGRPASVPAAPGASGGAASGGASTSVPALALDPAAATVPLGGTARFQAPGGAAVSSWRVVEGPTSGAVDAAGVYTAPATLPGGEWALTGVATVEATLADGRAASARVTLVRPRP